MEDMINTNVDILPHYYIHTALLKSQDILVTSISNDKVHNGLISYFVLIDHIEKLCIASGYIEQNYKDKVIEFMKKEHYQDAKEPVKSGLLANFKLGLLMSYFFKEHRKGRMR